MRDVSWVAVLILALVSTAAAQQTPPNIAQATAGGGKTGEVSTDDLRRILAEKSATVFDARPALEYAISHIPGALNVAPKPGVDIAKYVSDVAEIGRRLGGDKSKPVILYCNGPFCGKGSRLADELVAAGYTNVRRYQLGVPVWRALGGITQIEPEGVKHVRANDQTAVWIDARNPEQFQRGSLPGAKNVTAAVAQGGKDNPEMMKAKNDGRLPMNDHNTRIIVFGASAEEARTVAEALAREAFHNVSFFAGSFSELRELVGR
ncbi:MAG TPA: rhodanese-like domain-containing protein [Terriglobales bacterium]|jgi:rhodanese-related sulfurtransferase|nr:rhodanese-like domain-containing protein [Terriglobales bacterium]